MVTGCGLCPTADGLTPDTAVEVGTGVAGSSVDEREGQAVVELAGAASKADALLIAWRALGVVGEPGTSDVVPAVEWLAARGVSVARSRAYEVRRQLVARRRAVRGGAR